MPPKSSTCLTLHEKSLIIQELKKGASVTNLSKKYKVAKATICKIKNKQEEILRAVNLTYTGPGKRRTLKESKNPEMEKKLYKWFLDKRKENVVVSGDMIKKKAKALHLDIKGNDEFSASDGWLQRFKKRFGIRLLKNTGENLSYQPELNEPFKVKLKNKIEQLGITLDQLYNADESSLYWNLLPEKTFVSSQENTAGKTLEKQRLTFLACTNASGNHKVKPLVIGTAKNPKAFTNFSPPVDYNNSKSAWMTQPIFMNWFHHSFVPQVSRFLKSKGLPIKALLLLKNTSSHPPEDELQSEDGQIITMYLPANATDLMDQNVIKLTKLYYRSSLLRNIIANGSDIETLKDLTIKDAVINLMSAWIRLDPAIIAKCWKKLLNFSDQDEEDDLAIVELQRQWKESQTEAINESRDILNMLLPQAEFTEIDVINWNEVDTQVKNTDEDENENQNDETEDKPKQTVTPDSAINALNTSIQWAEENGIDSNYIQSLKELREKAVIQKVNEHKK